MPTTSEHVLADHLAVECVDLRKTYILGEELSLQKSLAQLPIIGPRFGEKPRTIDALQQLSFSIERGAFFGIVGPNGSGKSTLTQVISGIGVPDGGRAMVRGRVLPLLEVGAGFHAELTGRENVRLLGTVLGLDPRDIESATPEIAEFAGVESHMDTPLKRYSSGMQARLSFGVASRFPADIYIFDEVLAVVDDEFRDRCAGELRRLNAEGATIIFMSHDLELVRSLCSTGMWLERGHCRILGDMHEVASAYSQAHGRSQLADAQAS